MTLVLALKNAQTFTALRSLVETDKSNAKLTSLGKRSVTVNGYKDSLTIDDFAKHVMMLTQKNFEFSEEERAHGKFIAKRINAFYFNTDVEMGVKKTITRILCWLRDASFRLNTRWQWEKNGWNKTFKFYTKEQYQKAFNAIPPQGPDADILKKAHCPDRWLAPKEVTKLQKIEKCLGTIETSVQPIANAANNLGTQAKNYAKGFFSSLQAKATKYKNQALTTVQNATSKKDDVAAVTNAT